MARFSLDELSAAAGLPPRTIRFYQANDLLQKPRREGRQAVYSEDHLHRLELISDLRERGLKLGAIRDMVNAGSLGKAPVVALLGPDAANERWLTETARTFDAPALATFLGEANLGLLNELVEAGYLEPVQTEDGLRWHAPDLPLLRGALQLAEMGTDIALSARARDLMRRRLRHMVADLAALWVEQAGAEYAGEATAEEFEISLDRIRAIAWQSAAHLVAQEIDRAAQRAKEISRQRGDTDSPVASG